MRINLIKNLQNVRNFLNFENDVNFDKDKDENTPSGFKEKGDGRSGKKIIDVPNCIVYAPNGSGKTNLSRFLAILSSGEITALEKMLSKEAGSNFSKLKFGMTIDDNLVNQETWLKKEHQALLENIYVFNSDFVKENIQCEDFSVKDISGKLSIPIGKENLEINRLQEKIKGFEEDREDLFKELQAVIANKKLQLQRNKYGKRERSIWDNFSLDNIFVDDKFTFKEPKYARSYDDCEESLHKIKGLSTANKVTSNIQQFSIIKLNNIGSIYELLDTPKNFMEFDKDAENTLKRITTDWTIDHNLLEEGIDKSIKQNHCVLCQRKLNKASNGLFQRFKTYFKNEKGLFEKEIGNNRKFLDTLLDDLRPINNNNQSLVESLAKHFGIDQEWKDLSTNEIDQEIKKLQGILIEKKGSPSLIPIYTQDLLIKLKLLNKSIKENLALIQIVNKNIDKKNDQETKLRKKIGRKLLYDFYKENENTFDEIIHITELIDQHTENLKNLSKMLPSEDAARNVVELFNIFLHEYLDLNKYEALLDRKELKLKLERFDISKETSLLSEGEKNMLGLCYYFANGIREFGSKEKDLTNAIFIIDDPICSMSYGNFFGVCSLLKEFEKEVQRKLRSSDNSSVQKIILTHNTQLYNMLAQNVFKDKKTKYLLLHDNKMKEVPQKRFLSDFQMAIVEIYKASEEEDYVGNIGNAMRRFFEKVRHIYGEDTLTDEVLLRTFPKFKRNNHKAFRDAVNFYSHSFPDEDTLPPDTMQKAIAQFVELIEESDFKKLWDRAKEYSKD